MPTQLELHQVSTIKPSDLDHCDFSFDISEVLIKPFDSGLLRTKPVEGHTKLYGTDLDVLGEADGERYLAVAVTPEKSIQGYILVTTHWNGMASLEDIAVDQSVRRAGAAKQLLEGAKAWVRERGFMAMRAETQSNNVPACRLYHNCGFKLGGHDEFLYKAVEDEKVRNETAIFWYWFAGNDVEGEGQ